MDLTSLLLVLVISMVSVSAEVPNSGDVMSASLRLSSERPQFFKFQSVFLSCEDRQSNSTVWRVKRTNIGNVTSECDEDWGKMNNTGCIVRSMLPLLDTGAYWCESSKGKSNTVNITVTDGAVILESPVLPVMEGSDVTLHCWSRIKATAKPSADLPADFYKDGSLISTESTGQMTIHSVYKSDEGFYKCHISDLGESPESWMDVRVEHTPPPVVGLSFPHVVGVIVGLVSVILLTILLVLLCLYRTSKDPCCVRPVQPQGINQGTAEGQKTNQSGASDDVYCPLRHGNTSVYEVMNRSHHFPNESSRPQRSADPVYSNVRNHQRVNIR